MDVLKPNYMGDEIQNSGLGGMLENRGMQGEVANYGLGVAEVERAKANAQGTDDQHKTTNPSMEKLRRHKAREFGLTKETVGF
jgi:hypothetical protein